MRKACFRAVFAGISLSLACASVAQVFPTAWLKAVPAPKPKTEQESPAALPAPDDRYQALEIVRPGNITRKGDLLEIKGGGEVLYKGYRILADEISGNLKTNVFEGRGNTKVIGKDSTVVADRVIVNLDERSYRAFNATSIISPQLTQSQTTSPIFVRGGESSGTEKHLIFKDGRLTTCDDPNPHFHLDSESGDIKPGKRAILRHSKFALFGRTLFTIPFLVIPLDDRSYNYLPEVGQSKDEGYFIKNRYGIPLKGVNFLDTRQEYFTKLGLGLGANYIYQSALNSGNLDIYNLAGPSKTFRLDSTHRQQFGFGSLDLTGNFSKDNYLTAPEATTFSLRTTAQIKLAPGQFSRVGYSLQNNENGGFSSKNEAFSLGVPYRFSKRGTLNLDTNYTIASSDGGGGTDTKREQVEVRFRGTEELAKARLTLDYQRTIPVGEVSNFFGGSDRTPVVTLESDSRRLIGGDFAKDWPFRTSVSMGEFVDGRSRSRITRSFFDVSLNKNANISESISTATNFAFKQGLYSDDTALYTLNGSTRVSYKWDQKSSVNLRYSYLRPYGFSPLQLDRSGRTNLASLDTSVQIDRAQSIGLQTGYDIRRLEQNQPAWQQVGLRYELNPGPNFLLRALASYDSPREYWSSVRLDMTLISGQTRVVLGSRYDGLRHTWGNVNATFEGIRIGKIGLRSLLNYNGFTKQFDVQEHEFVYNLHCWEAVLSVEENKTGFRPGRQINFFMRLKAIPYNPSFGVGRSGQPFGTGTGRDF